MISKSMMKKYFDRWTDSSYSNDVITTSIGYNYIDEKEDYEMQLYYLEDPTNKTKEQESLGVYSLLMRKDSVVISGGTSNPYDIIESNEHFEYHTDSFIHLMKVLRKFYPDSVDEKRMTMERNFICDMSNILQDFCKFNNLPYKSADDLLYGKHEKPISFTKKQRDFLISYISMWDRGVA